MSCFRCGDPLDDFNRLDREQAKCVELLPVCYVCGQPIQDDHYYEIESKNFCPDCLDDCFRKEVDIYG